jgi:hypothetical protein
MVQTLEDGKHDILPVAGLAGPRGSACDVAPYLPIATCAATVTMLQNEQPNQPVDERGGVHGVPDLDHFAEPCGTPWETMRFTGAKEKMR